MTELLVVGPLGDRVTRFQRAVGALEPGWSLQHCSDGNSAVTHLEGRSADVVIGCFDSPADHEALFDRVMDVSPASVRLSLLDRPPANLNGAHQVMAMRDNPDDVHAILLAAVDVAARMARDETLMRLIGRFRDVPSPPLLYFDVREQIEQASATTTSMADIASRDPALVARTLKIANSGFYARPRTIGDLHEAISLIGTDTLLGLVLAAHLFSGLPPPGLKLDALWQHSTQVARLAQQIARIEGADRRQLGHSFVAGLLHDIGLMVLLQNETVRYQPMLVNSDGDESVLTPMELETFGITHGQLGGIILQLWSLPAEVADAVAASHPPSHACMDGHAPPLADDSLGLPGRAVLAAEWMLGGAGHDEPDALPAALVGTAAPTLTRWFEARRQLEAG